ncbi:Hypothetical protein UVM_LOCUS304 [uncultured virus]|nr:Hypothetical protein UVM_LOCUS304 [uncultured virus]
MDPLAAFFVAAAIVAVLALLIWSIGRLMKSPSGAFVACAENCVKNNCPAGAATASQCGTGFCGCIGACAAQVAAQDPSLVATALRDFQCPPGPTASAMRRR